MRFASRHVGHLPQKWGDSGSSTFEEAAALAFGLGKCKLSLGFR